MWRFLYLRESRLRGCTVVSISVDVTKKVESAVEVSVCMTTTRNHLTPCFNFKLSHNIVQLMQNPLPKTKHQFVSNHWI